MKPKKTNPESQNPNNDGTDEAPASPTLAKASKGSTKGKVAVTSGEIAILAPSIQSIRLHVVGTTDLIVHQWSEKAKRMIRDKQSGAAKQGKGARDTDEEFESAKYLDENNHDCFPTRAFKRALVDAASFSDGVTKVLLRGAVFIDGEMVPLKYEKCEKREDTVRIGMGTADLRYRPGYKGWSVVLPLQINVNVISLAQVVNLFQLAGFSIGVGEWRPQCDGQFGRFNVSAQITQ